MNRYIRENIFGGGGTCCVLLLLMLAINLIFGGMCTEYCLHYWFNRHVPFIIASIIGLVAGELTIPAAVVTFLLVYYEAMPIIP